jgi:hypothetical protein
MSLYRRHESCLYIGDVSHVSIVCKPIACMLRCNERVAIEVVKDGGRVHVLYMYFT